MGLNVTLRAPFPIQISQSLRPFLQETAPRQEDCTIQILEGCLPQPAQDGYWHGLEYYDRAGDIKRIFHCHKPFSDPFAVTQFDGKGQICITVTPSCTDYFSGTSGIFNRIGFENLLLQYSGLLLHASLIEYAHQGIAFTGPSGVGKSTQADLWQRCFGAKILNGDRAALRKCPDGWIAYGSPYAGSSGIYCNDHTPLTAIVVLCQSRENRLRQLSSAEAIRHIWPELSVRRQDGDFVAAAMALCDQLLQDVPVYCLECLPDKSAATLLKEGLSL